MPPTSRVRLPLIASSCLAAGLGLACLEPPDLDAVEPPLLDLGGLDTWAPLDLPPELDGGDAEPMPGSNDGADTGQDPPALADPKLAQLRLTEVLADPEGKDGGVDAPEFVEVLNPGPAAVDLSGLRIQAASWPELDGPSLGLVGLTLEPNDLMVIYRWASDIDPPVTIEIEAGRIALGFAHSGGLRNGDGRIALLAGESVIDELVYGDDGAQAASAPGSGQSLCRDAQATDTDQASDWSACAPSPGELSPSETPGGSDPRPTPIPVGAVQIVEVSANPPGPASEEKAYEFIEIINLSENEVELSNARIGDDPSPDAAGVDPLTYASGDGGCPSLTCLAPGYRALLVGQGYAGEVGSALVLETDDSTLADGGLTNAEPVVLWDGPTLITSYRLWPDPAGEPLPSDEQPLHRVDPLGLDAPDNWVSAPPSPGE